MASSGQAHRQAPQPVQRSGWVSAACLRWPTVSRVSKWAGQAATQRPQPEQRFVSMTGTGFRDSGDIAEQPRLLPLLALLLLRVERVVARTGGDQGKGRLFAGTAAAGAEFVGRAFGLGLIGRLLGHRLPWGPGKLSPGEYMNVQMEHGLAGIGTVVLH